MSACKLLPTVYGRLQVEQKPGILSSFFNLCNDETPMVRRTACSNVGKLTAVLDPEITKNNLIPVFRNLIEDQQDSIRLLSIENIHLIGKTLDIEVNINYLKPMVVTVCEDSS